MYMFDVCGSDAMETGLPLHGELRMKRFAIWVAFLPVLISGAAPAAGDAGAGDPSLLDVALESGGWTIYVLVGLSVFATFLVVIYLLTLRANVLYPKAFVRDAQDAAEAGDIEALVAICRENDSPASRIIGAAAEQMGGAQRTDYLIVRDAIEDEGAREASLLWQRIQYLLDVAVVAPMVGLLGTVLGMLDSFGGVKAELGRLGSAAVTETGAMAVSPTDLAHGVSKALITTAGGLIVGIGAMVLYAFFRGRVGKLVSGLESACSRILRRFVTNL